METFEGFAQAADAARGFIYSKRSQMPAHIRETLEPLTKTGVSPVDLTVKFVETVYANQDIAVMQEAAPIAAGCAVVCETFGFHDMNEDQRGSKIAQFLDGIEVAEPPAVKQEFTQEGVEAAKAAEAPPPAPAPAPNGGGK